MINLRVPPRINGREGDEMMIAFSSILVIKKLVVVDWSWKNTVCLPPGLINDLEASWTFFVVKMTIL
jgi:hypothetical protein